jgi:tol-pal system protein YbgF
MRIDRLEAQIRQLTGAIEQLQHRNQQLETQLRRVLDEAENRSPDTRGANVRPAAPGRPAANPSAAQAPAAVPPAATAPVASPQVAASQLAPPPVAAAQPAAPATTGATPGRRGDAFDPSQNPGAPGAPRPIGTSVPSAPIQPYPGGDEPVGAPGGRSAGAPLDLSALVASTIGPASGPASSQSRGGDQSPPARAPAAPGTQVATLPPSDNPRDHYDFAYGHVLRKDYAAAEDGFRNFLGRFPSDRLVPEAQYWLGESLFQRQRYRDAAETFLTVSTKHESTSRAPDALLRLGQSLAALGEREAACASFGEVLRKYPRASTSVKQGVDREQKRVRC